MIVRTEVRGPGKSRSAYPLDRWLEVRMRRWPLREARARLSKLIRSSAREGPQEITVRGVPAAVVLSAEDYEGLHQKKSRSTVRDFLRRSAEIAVDLDLDRRHKSS